MRATVNDLAFEAARVALLCQTQAARIKELEAALRMLIDTETDRYACASERSTRYAGARAILDKQKRD